MDRCLLRPSKSDCFSLCKTVRKGKMWNGVQQKKVQNKAFAKITRELRKARRKQKSRSREHLFRANENSRFPPVNRKSLGVSRSSVWFRVGSTRHPHYLSGSLCRFCILWDIIVIRVNRRALSQSRSECDKDPVSSAWPAFIMPQQQQQKKKNAAYTIQGILSTADAHTWMMQHRGGWYIIHIHGLHQYYWSCGYLETLEADFGINVMHFTAPLEKQTQYNNNVYPLFLQMLNNGT